MKKKDKDHLNKNENIVKFQRERFKCDQFKLTDLFDDDSELDLIRVLKYDFDKLDKIPSIQDNVISIILNSEKIKKMFELSKDEILASCPIEYVEKLTEKIDALIADDSDDNRKNLVARINIINKEFPELYFVEKIIRKSFLKVLKEAKK